MGKFDPVAVLMDHTREGVLSQIQYNKGETAAPKVLPLRLIEPRALIDGVAGLMVRAVQLKPERGVRHFYAERIVRVEPGDGKCSTGNTFCDGCLTLRMSGGRNKAATNVSPSDPRFVQYAAVVRDAILDLHVDADEIEAVENKRDELRVSSGEMRAVHSYVFAEFLLGYSADGIISLDEEEHIEMVASCLDSLGWRPA